MTHDPREALEPCPFCGGEAKIFSYRTSEDSEGVHIECIKCGVRTDATDDAYADRLTAVSMWNTRALTASPGEQKPVAHRIRVVDGSYCKVIPEGELEIWKQNWSTHLKSGHARLEPLYTSQPPAAAESNASAEAVELAYGLLWVVGCDRSTRGGNALYLARKALLEQLDRAGQGRGISAARKVLKDEEAGCGGIGYSVSGRVCSDLDGRTSSRSGDTGACDPASGGVASLHNDGHTEGAARPDGLSVEARLREALIELVSRSQAARDHIGSSSTLDNDGNDRFIKIAGIVEPLEHAIGAATTALSAVGDEAKKSEGGPLNWQLSDDAKARLAEIDDNLRNAAINASNIVAGNPSSPTAERREIDPKVLLLLQMVERAKGEIDTTEHDNSLLNFFCDDRGRETDTYNLAIDAGYLRSSFNDLFETSRAYLTDAGRAILAALDGGAGA